MNDIKDFKRIADVAMSEIYVTEEMKDRVINRSRRKSRIPVGRLAALAACAVVVLGVLNLTGVLKIQNGQEDQQNQINIFSATNTSDLGIASLPGPSDAGAAEQSGTGSENNPGTSVGWNPATLEEAGASFGHGFLIPAYTPEGFKLNQISASGKDTQNAVNIVITYNSAEESFTITERKESGAINPQLFKGYRKVKIGGSDGYIKTAGADGTSSAGADTTEVHWSDNNFGYSVTGNVTQEDALMIAEMMLPLSQ